MTAVHVRTWSLAILIAALAMLGPFSIDAYLPAFHAIGSEFGVPQIAVQQTLSMYLFAYAFMMLWHGALADALGRRPVVLASLASADEHEGIPVSLMEAMAAGVPVVATDSGGTSELIGGGAGLLVPVGDVDALADALRGIVSDQELRRAASEGGRRRVAESFDVDVIAAELRRRFSACET